MAELSIRDKKRIKKHVANCCANYSKEYGCLPLETECYMFSVGFTDSKLCKYYEQAVMPTDAELFALFKGIPTKKCRHCVSSLLLLDERRIVQSNVPKKLAAGTQQNV